ncbi:DUF456 domain-containing protein [Halobacteria archaeon AArc-dxtr1]|nr:DUF456 domain-containing protein [Halobacteria archaeon AArc-dxtr1]
MSDRSEEVTTDRDEPSTDELVAETERLLSGDADLEADEATEDRSRGVDGLSDSWSGSPSEEAATDSETSGDTSTSRLGSLGARLSPTRYFSVGAFLVCLLAVGTGLFVGDLLVPVAGRLLGMFLAALLAGLVAPTRRYLEVAAAGISVGAVSSVFNYAVLTLIGGIGSPLALGATAGLVVCVLGYYFGRDIRDGFLREV